MHGNRNFLKFGQYRIISFIILSIDPVRSPRLVAKSISFKCDPVHFSNRDALCIRVGGNDNLSRFGRYFIKLFIYILESRKMCHFDQLHSDRSRLLVLRKLVKVVHLFTLIKHDGDADTIFTNDNNFLDFPNDNSFHSASYATRNHDLFNSKSGAISREDLSLLTIKYIISIGI